MPIPTKFFDSDGNEVSLEFLCLREPGWAANQIRTLYKQYDELIESLCTTKQQVDETNKNQIKPKHDCPFCQHLAFCICE